MEAMLAFSFLFENHRDHPDVINGFGTCAWSLGHSQEALSLFMEGLRLVPGHPDLLANLTDSGIALGCPPEVKSLVEETFERNPDNPAAAFYFGKWLAAEGSIDKAQPYFDKAGADPRFQEAVEAFFCSIKEEQ
jgi:tetratricopeptide (TPR) repeat protein